MAIVGQSAFSMINFQPRNDHASRPADAPPARARVQDARDLTTGTHANEAAPKSSWQAPGTLLALVVAIIGISLGIAISLLDLETGAEAYKRGDNHKAAKLFTLEAERGDANSQYSLGVMYYNGQLDPAPGTKEAVQAAAKWWWRAAAQNLPSPGPSSQARSNLARIYLEGLIEDGPHDDFVKITNAAANQGNPSAQTLLGVLFFTGMGVPQNYFEGARWYRKAAEQDSEFAKVLLGFAYRLGKGVTKDDSQAAMLFEGPAKTGYANAAYELGIMNRKGEGVETNLESAVHWFTLVIRKNRSGPIRAKAEYKLSKMYDRGQGVMQDTAETERLLRSAALHGHAQAEREVALIESLARLRFLVQEKQSARSYRSKKLKDDYTARMIKAMEREWQRQQLSR